MTTHTAITVALVWAAAFFTIWCLLAAENTDDEGR